MINNCPKCGNPLQEGTSSCPICGTNIISTPGQTQEPVVSPTPVVEAQAQPVVAPTEVQPVVEAPVVEQPIAPVVETQVVQAEIAPVAPVTSVIPAAVTPVVQSTVQPVAEQPVAQTVVAPNPQTVQPVAPAPVKVTIEPTVAPQLAPVTPTVAPASIAQSLEAIAAQTPSQPVVEAPVVEENKPKAKKVDIKNLTKNQKIIAVAVVAVIIMVIVGISLSSSSLGKPSIPAQTPVAEQNTVTREIASNGYKLKLEEGWIIEEGSGTIIIKKEDDSVIINLKCNGVSIDTINKETLTSYFSSQANFKDIQVDETELSGKKTYITNITYTSNVKAAEYPVQYYYINGGSNLIIGATIIYQDEEAKTSNAAFITNLMGTLSYADDTIKALDTVNMYSEVFQKYVYSLRPPVIPNEQTVEETPTESPENQS